MRKQRSLVWLAALALLAFAVAPAMAGMTYGDGGANLEKVLDDITTAPVFGDSSVDVINDPIAEGLDDMWSITASGGSTATMIIEVAGWDGTNKLGVYDFYDTSKSVELFAGGATDGDQAALSIKADGSVWVVFTDVSEGTITGGNTGVKFSSKWFGYYMDSSSKSEGGFWYSDTTENADGMDHMVAIQGTDTDTVQLPTLPAALWTDNEYILAFEDKAKDYSDRDYDDLVVMVESVVVPVPAAVLLGMLGLGAAGLKLRKRS